MEAVAVMMGASTHMPDGSMPDTILINTAVEDTRIVVLQSKTDGCYTMQLYKCNKLIGEAASEENNLGKLMCLLLAKIPIDPKFLKLN